MAARASAGMKAAIGDVRRFCSSSNLVSYFGLNPSVYQSGLKGYTGHISRRGRSHARTICIEAAHQLVRVPGPFHAFFQRLRHRKPHNVAITAVARKLAVVIWQMLTREENYRYAPPAPTRVKLDHLRRLASGEAAPRTRKTLKQTGLEPDSNPGRRGEDDYLRFLRDRFGKAGPRGVDHPNSPKISKDKEGLRRRP
jgi:hypothetical protein